MEQAKQSILTEFKEMLKMHPIVDDPNSPLCEADKRLRGLEQNGTGSLVCPECGESDLLLKIDYGFDDVMFDLSKMEIANEKFFPVEGPRIIIREIFCSFCGHNVLSGNENLKHKRD